MRILAIALSVAAFCPSANAQTNATAPPANADDLAAQSPLESAAGLLRSTARDPEEPGRRPNRGRRQCDQLSNGG